MAALKLTFKPRASLSFTLGGLPSLSMAVNGQAVSVQTKAVTPSDHEQEITPDQGYYLSKVTVRRIPNYYGHIAYNGGILTVY